VKLTKPCVFKGIRGNLSNWKRFGGHTVIESNEDNYFINLKAKSVEK
jgi:hypothetical protein